MAALQFRYFTFTLTNSESYLQFGYCKHVWIPTTIPPTPLATAIFGSAKGGAVAAENEGGEDGKDTRTTSATTTSDGSADSSGNGDLVCFCIVSEYPWYAFKHTRTHTHARSFSLLLSLSLSLSLSLYLCALCFSCLLFFLDVAGDLQANICILGDSAPCQSLFQCHLSI